MNGQEVMQKPQTAREMTEEINRATDVEVNPAQARGIGSAAMGAANEQGREPIYGPASEVADGRMQGVADGRIQGMTDGRGLEMTNERASEMAGERVWGMTEADNGYSGGEYGANVSTVGEESALEVAERRAADYENLMMELKPEGNEAKQVYRTQEEIGKATAREVRQFAGKASFVVDEVVRLQREEAAKTLALWGRTLGDRN